MSAPRHVVVVGAGIIGASVAFHLARHGLGVTVIAGTPGGVATPASFGWINASWGNRPDYAAFRMAAMAEWQALLRDMPDLPATFRGGLLWDLAGAELDAYLGERKAQGYAIRAIDRSAIAAIEPGLADPPERAVHAADEGAAEPAEAAMALLDTAVRAGATVLDGKAVALRFHGDRVTGVITSVGELRADHTVIASGTGAPPLLHSAGVALPLADPPGLLVTTEPAPAGFVRGLVLAPDLHVRQRADGRLVAGGDFGGSDPGERTDATALALHEALVRLLGTAAPPLHAWSVGRRPTPEDGHPVLGHVPDRPGLSVAVTHSGVTLAPLVGRLVASEIASGHAEAMLALWSIGRFG